MENFVVSARKYRPTTFNSVVGQQAITGTLKNALRNNQLAQAFLFCGPRGVGKTTCARILAKTINCNNLTEDFEACNECESCKAFNASSAFNIFELDAASNNSVDDIRDLVNQVRIPPQMGKYKVYIIDEVHMLSVAAFNAFLKTLEEPPAYAKFILATTEKHKIIPTILSRCQIFDFKRITVKDIASHLQFVSESEKVTYDPDALHFIAQKADGALRDALSMFDQMVSLGNHNVSRQIVVDNLNILDYDYYFRIVDNILNGEIAESLNIVNNIIDKGFEGQHFVVGFAQHLRNLMMSKDTRTVSIIEVGDSIKQQYIKQAEAIPYEFLIQALDILNKTDVNYRSSNNKRLTIEVALIQMFQFVGKIKMLAPKTIVEEKTESELKLNIKSETKAIEEKAEPEVIKKEVKKEIQKIEKPEPIAKTEEKNIEQKADNKLVEGIRKVEEVEIVEKGEKIEKIEKLEEPIVEKVPKETASTEDKKFKTPVTGFSIKEIHKEEKKEQKAVVYDRKEAFTEQGLVAAVQDFLNNNESSHLLALALTANKPKLVGDTEMKLTVSNLTLEAEVRKFSSDFMPYIKDFLKNDFITYSVDVKEENNFQPKTKTNEQQFEEMKNKNENVQKLAKNLDLFFDTEAD